MHDEKYAAMESKALTGLARDNGWSQNYALRVIAEYKRFVYLAKEAGVEEAAAGAAMCVALWSARNLSRCEKAVTSHAH
jgi:hypothetical protein